MTTSSFKGLLYRRDGDQIGFARGSTIQLVTSDDIPVSYAAAGRQDGLPRVTFDPVALQAVRVDGRTITDFDAFAFTLTWGKKKAATFLAFHYDAEGKSVKVGFLQMGGAELPVIAGRDDLKSFLDKAKAGPIASGPFGPDSPLEFSSFGGFLSQTEDDVLKVQLGTTHAVFTGLGDDRVTGNTQANTIDGGAGDDTINGSAGSDLLDGGSDDDRLIGGAGVDTLNGGAGNDSLSGGNNGDAMDGGAGNDTLDGGSVQDTLTGGEGADTFRFVGSSFGRDTITDFEGGVDRLEFAGTSMTLDQIRAAAFQSGEQVIINLDGGRVTLDVASVAEVRDAIFVV